jgi:hypothetical protein
VFLAKRNEADFQECAMKRELDHAQIRDVAIWQAAAVDYVTLRSLSPFGRLVTEPDFAKRAKKIA